MGTDPRRIIVTKTRAMIAAEVGDALDAAKWERGILKRLGTPTLTRLAERVVPGYKPQHVLVDETG